MQAVRVSNWFHKDYPVYIVASVKFDSDGTQYPWISAFNFARQNFMFTTCVKTKLIGAYNKDSNLNFVPGNLACTDCIQYIRVLIRSQDYGGI